MSKQLTNQSAKQTKQERRRERREEQRRREEARLRTIRNWRLAIATVIAVLIVAGSSFALYTLANSRAAGPSTATNNNTSDNAAYPPIDNVACQTNEQLAYHIHVHLSLYINGAPVQVPASIGIASDGSCFYWLHVHDTSGVVHIEAPTQKIYTLGNFFHLWGQRFAQLRYPAQLESTSDWQVFVNGKPYTGDFHAIPLTAHTLITMGYKSPGIVPDTTYNWGGL